MTTRYRVRAPLVASRYDVIVICGDVNGVAIARECALAGKRTLILEQQDFASGTSSRSTRIIHGGLRYLEHGELALVRESLRERDLLLRQRPTLVRPMNFILALPDRNSFGRRSALAVRAGLAMYRRIAKSQSHLDSPEQEMETLQRSLDSGMKWSVFDYEDAQCEFPERLIAEWLVEAIEAGAVARNHTQVLAVTRAEGKVSGVITRDSLSNLETTFPSDCIINATGPWADRICADSGISANRMIGGIRGSHILLPKFAGAPHSAIYAEAVDRRQVFVIPWNGQTLVGTTEVADDGDPGRSTPTTDEFQYLFACFSRIFPNSGLHFADITAGFAGVRPLPFVQGKKASAVTRKHFIHDHRDDGALGLYSVIGGKLTTAASLARDCARKIGIAVAEPITIVANKVAATHDQRAISEWHPRHAEAIVRAAAGNPQLAAKLCPHSDHIVAEAVHAVESECAVTLGDMLLRRVPVALGQCWNSECTDHAAKNIGAALQWTQEEISTAKEDFEIEHSRFMHKPVAAATSTR
ncbi:MAG: dependent oxidoreductase [Acidobacteriales bacterium]|nr:dependent oxidoreductase [Terriglobales bacterium]